MNNYGLTEEDFEKSTPIEEKYEIIESLTDHRFGEIVLLQNKLKKEKLIFRKEKFSTKLSESAKNIYQAKERKKLKSDYILKMEDYSSHLIHKEDEKMEFLVAGFYEYPEWDLEREFEKRKKAKNYFKGEDLSKLIKDLLNAVYFLQDNRMIHGDIRPKYIFYEKKKKIYKLVDHLSDPHSPNKIQIDNLRQKNKIYMSPVLFESFSFKSKKIRHNPFKSDLFSLGMVILEIGILKNIQSIYDYDSKKINIEIFIGFIENFMEIYEEFYAIQECLLHMLDLQEESRLDPKNCYEYFENLRNENETDIENNNFSEIFNNDKNYEKKKFNNYDLKLNRQNQKISFLEENNNPKEVNNKLNSNIIGDDDKKNLKNKSFLINSKNIKLIKKKDNLKLNIKEVEVKKSFQEIYIDKEEFLNKSNSDISINNNDISINKNELDKKEINLNQDKIDNLQKNKNIKLIKTDKKNIFQKFIINKTKSTKIYDLKESLKKNKIKNNNKSQKRKIKKKNISLKTNLQNNKFSTFRLNIDLNIKKKENFLNKKDPKNKIIKKLIKNPENIKKKKKNF